MNIRKKHIYGVLGVFFLTLSSLYNNCGTGVGNVEFFNSTKKKIPQATQKLTFIALNTDASDKIPDISTSTTSASANFSTEGLKNAETSGILNALEIVEEQTPDTTAEPELTKIRACVDSIIVYGSKSEKYIYPINDWIIISKDGSLKKDPPPAEGSLDDKDIKITAPVGLKIKSVSMTVSADCSGDSEQNTGENTGEPISTKNGDSFVLYGEQGGEQGGEQVEAEEKTQYEYHVGAEMVFVFMGDYFFGYEENFELSFALISEKFRSSLATLNEAQITTIVSETSGEVLPNEIIFETAVSERIREWRNADTYEWYDYETVIAYVLGVGVNIHNNTDKDITEADKLSLKVDGTTADGSEFCGGWGVPGPIEIPARTSWFSVDLHWNTLSLGSATHGCVLSKDTLLRYCIYLDSVELVCHYKYVELIPTEIMY